MSVMIFEKFGLKRIVNAAGKMTYLGGTSIDEAVLTAMADMGRSYVDMNQLSAKVGEIISAVTGAEAGYPVNSAASGITIATAACLAGSDLLRVRRLPDTSGFERREIIIQAGHAVDFGAQIVQVLRLAGASVVSIGSVNKTDEAELENSIDLATAVLVYVVSHHTAQEGMLPLQSFVRAAKTHGLPLIVDAAAETDLKKYIAAGADLVVYSGQKAVSSPTAGFICGRRELIQACRLQERGLGRAMKVSKENMVGLAVALLQYAAGGEEQALENEERLLKLIVPELETLPHVEVSVVKDPIRPLRRVQLRFDENALGFSALHVVEMLEGGEPSIRTRNHKVEHGIIQLDLRPLKDEDVDIVVRRLHEILKNVEDGK